VGRKGEGVGERAGLSSVLFCAKYPELWSNMPKFGKRKHVIVSGRHPGIFLWVERVSPELFLK
jgi:hypothetical protein